MKTIVLLFVMLLMSPIAMAKKCKPGYKSISCGKVKGAQRANYCWKGKVKSKQHEKNCKSSKKKLAKRKKKKINKKMIKKSMKRKTTKKVVPEPKKEKPIEKAMLNEEPVAEENELNESASTNEDM